MLAASAVYSMLTASVLLVDPLLVFSLYVQYYSLHTVSLIRPDSCSHLQHVQSCDFFFVETRFMALKVRL